MDGVGDKLAKIAALVDGWTETWAVNELERDMALEMLREVYSAVKFRSVTGEVAASEPTVELASEPAAEPAKEPELATVAESEPEPEARPVTELEPVAVAEPEPEPAPETEPAEEVAFEFVSASEEPEPESERTEEPEPNPEAEAKPATEPDPEPTYEPEPATVSDEDLQGEDCAIAQVEILSVMRGKIDPGIIRSLYGEEPESEEEGMPKEEAKPKQEAKSETSATYTEPKQPENASAGSTIGDVVGSGRKTLGESLRTKGGDVASAVAATTRPTLRKSIGLNDRFLMIRDMFDGNGKEFEEAIERLDAFDDLDSAIIYIHDTYRWSADSAGVKRLVDLLERKLG